jgi:precorrin-4 methylase
MEGNINLNPPIPPSASSEEILEKLETIIEKMEEPKEASASTSIEEYKITIMVTTISHGEKIILRPQLKNLEEFEDYEKRYKTALKTLTRELSRMKFNAKKLYEAKFAAGRRQRIMDGLARGRGQ